MCYLSYGGILLFIGYNLHFFSQKTTKKRSKTMKKAKTITLSSFLAATFVAVAIFACSNPFFNDNNSLLQNLPLTENRFLSYEVNLPSVDFSFISEEASFEVSQVVSEEISLQSSEEITSIDFLKLIKQQEEEVILNLASGRISYFQYGDGSAGGRAAITRRCLSDYDPDDLYCAFRFNYERYPRRLLLESTITIVAEESNRSVSNISPIDWGPARWTGRIVDVSPGVMNALDATTDDRVEVFIHIPKNLAREEGLIGG